MQHEIHPKRALGQNFLRDVSTLAYLERQIQQLIETTKATTVLEIGPGKGALTRICAAYAKRVVAVEKDDRLIPYLHKMFEEESISNVELIHADARTIGTEQIPEPYLHVSNLPFNSGTFLLRSLTEATHPPVASLVILQKEVAERITARDGKQSLLSLAIQLYAVPTVKKTIPRAAFTPHPEVDAALLLLEKREDPAVRLDDKEKEEFFRIIRWAFSAKRKQIRNTIASGAHKKPQDIEQLLQSTAVSPHARPEDLTLKDWQEVYLAAKEQQLL